MNKEQPAWWKLSRADRRRVCESVSVANRQLTKKTLAEKREEEPEVYRLEEDDRREEAEGKREARQAREDGRRFRELIGLDEIDEEAEDG